MSIKNVVLFILIVLAAIFAIKLAAFIVFKFIGILVFFAGVALGYALSKLLRW